MNRQELLAREALEENLILKDVATSLGKIDLAPFAQAMHSLTQAIAKVLRARLERAHSWPLHWDTAQNYPCWCTTTNGTDH